ncbi:hypothetical protein GCM10011511_14870 [Puia dinghuensis]|uniref:Uncharacterized protein n=1 Tax=Puia dinghuensis TaxID=1792502 RepID=A0A8J2UBG5_9BACT|nr:hypothetical protein GCM10011511_14870 [Puia dinghuensis]
MIVIGAFIWGGQLGDVVHLLEGGLTLQPVYHDGDNGFPGRAYSYYDHAGGIYQLMMAFNT